MNLDSRDPDLRPRTLCQHERDKAGAGADVQDVTGLPNLGPGAQQNTVGAGRLRNAFLLKVKLFETKKRRCHGRLLR